MRSKKILLVVDVQDGLFNKSMKVYNETSLIDNINRLIDLFHTKNEPVVFIRHTNNSLLIKDSKNWNLHHKLHRDHSDIMIDKRKSNVFEEHNILPILHAASINKVIITGIVTHGCVQAACYGARQNGFEVVLIKDAHSSFNKRAKELIIEWNDKICQEQGMSVVSTDDFTLEL